jgi:probable lipoprotein NlpC
MNTKLVNLLKTYLILFLIPLLFIAMADNAFAKKKRGGRKGKSKTHRVYNSEKTRKEALNMIVSNSKEVSDIAGLESNADNTTKIIKANDGELFDNDDESMIDPNTGEVLGDNGEDLAELEQFDDVQVSNDKFHSLWLTYVDDTDESGNAAMTAYGLKKSDIMGKIMNWMGTPYRMGGMSRKAIDCSAFVQAIFYQTANVLLPRTAREQVNVGSRVRKMNDLQFGDLIFFHTYSRRFASHVGIYLGDNLFAHASSRSGVTVSSLESTFYMKHFIGGKRLSASDVQQLSTTEGKLQSAN